MTTQLKDYRYDFPLEKRGEKKRRAAKVEVTDNGYFKIYFPKEVVQRFNLSNDYASGSTLNEAIGSFGRQMEDYKNAVQTEKREQVIVVRYLFNKPYDQGFGGTYQLGRKDSHFSHQDDAGRYGLALDYEVLWRIGNGIYEVPIDERNGRVYGEPHHRYHYPIANKAYHVIDWTEEREQFFSKMTMGLENMIARLNQFFGDDLLANMTKAIAAGGGFASLPAPEKKA
jgi:hypothetical protein